MDAAPQFSPTHYSDADKHLSDVKSGDHFIIEDLLNFPNDDTLGLAADGGPEVQITGGSTDSSTVTLIDTSCNSFSPSEPRFSPNPDIAGPAAGHFSGDLFPYEDLPELEWISKFVEESFSNSSEDFQKLHLIHGIKTRPDEAPQYQFQPQSGSSSPIRRPPAKARSKRSRAAPGDWASRLLMLSLPQTAPAPTLSSSSESDVAATTKKTVTPKKKEVAGDNSTGGEGWRCLHCDTDKTPQWRTGPMGPKTLCNACGVRYKSGRLVPEYRPAASPSFSQAKHSNSHRKVLELRRQKEMQLQQQRQPPFLHHHQNMVFDVSNGDDYLIHQHIGPNYRQQLF